jgi:hypothetical protein
MIARNNRGIVTIRDMTDTAVAMVQLSTHFSADRIHAPIEELFSVRSVSRGYKKDKEDCLSYPIWIGQ